MKLTITIFVLLSAIALADETKEPTNLKLRLKPSSGELVPTDKPCGKIIQAELWDAIFKTPWLEIVDDSMQGATASYKGDPFLGHWRFVDKIYVISVTLPKTRKQRSVVTSFLISYTTPVGQCSEKWLGLSERW